MEKTFLNPATNKQWRIEIDGQTIQTCLNGGKVKEILDHFGGYGRLNL